MYLLTTLAYFADGDLCMRRSQRGLGSQSAGFGKGVSLLEHAL